MEAVLTLPRVIVHHLQIDDDGNWQRQLIHMGESQVVRANISAEEAIEMGSDYILYFQANSKLIVPLVYEMPTLCVRQGIQYLLPLEEENADVDQYISVTFSSDMDESLRTDFHTILSSHTDLQQLSPEEANSQALAMSTPAAFVAPQPPPRPLGHVVASSIESGSEKLASAITTGALFAGAAIVTVAQKFAPVGQPQPSIQQYSIASSSSSAVSQPLIIEPATMGHLHRGRLATKILYKMTKTFVKVAENVVYRTAQASGIGSMIPDHPIVHSSAYAVGNVLDALEKAGTSLASTGSAAAGMVMQGRYGPQAGVAAQHVSGMMTDTIGAAMHWKRLMTGRRFLRSSVARAASELVHQERHARQHRVEAAGPSQPTPLHHGFEQYVYQPPSQPQ